MLHLLSPKTWPVRMLLAHNQCCVSKDLLIHDWINERNVRPVDCDADNKLAEAIEIIAWVHISPEVEPIKGQWPKQQMFYSPGAEVTTRWLSICRESLRVRRCNVKQQLSNGLKQP